MNASITKQRGYAMVLAVVLFTFLGLSLVGLYSSSVGWGELVNPNITARIGRNSAAYCAEGTGLLLSYWQRSACVSLTLSVAVKSSQVG